MGATTEARSSARCCRRWRRSSAPRGGRAAQPRGRADRRLRRTPTDDADASRAPSTAPAGAVKLWTSTYAPYFGAEELALLRDARSTDRARTRPLAALHARARGAAGARAGGRGEDELRRARRARAAHAGRERSTGWSRRSTPGATSSTTGQRGSSRRSLREQTTGWPSLVEQLLDLSRLDAEAVAIRPAAARDPPARRGARHGGARRGRASAVDIDVDSRPRRPGRPDGVRPDRLQPRSSTRSATARRRFVISAEQHDRHFRARGRGPRPGRPGGVRARPVRALHAQRRARARAGGTGLGLAIARSYAQAHRGDLLYEPAEPTRRALPARPARSASKQLMRARGLEPPRAFAQRVLNPSRLPVPPHPHGAARG